MGKVDTVAAGQNSLPRLSYRRIIGISSADRRLLILSIKRPSCDLQGNRRMSPAGTIGSCPHAEDHYRFDRRRRFRRTGEAEDLVAVRPKFGDDRGSDVT